MVKTIKVALCCNNRRNAPCHGNSVNSPETIARALHRPLFFRAGSISWKPFAADSEHRQVNNFSDCGQMVVSGYRCQLLFFLVFLLSVFVLSGLS